MIAKVGRGGGFRGVLNYVCREGARAKSEESPERVGGNMSGQNARDLAHEIGAVRQLRPDVARPVWACSLSLPKGEFLASEKWSRVCEDFMKKMGYDTDRTPYVAMRHQDTDHDHVHIVASRVNLDGKVWLGQWEARRAIEATRALEKEHGLSLTVARGDRAERKHLTASEINQAVRTGDAPARQQLQRLVEVAAQGNPTSVEFAQRLTAAGVTVRANIASTGRMNGFSYELGGVAFKGSDLGVAYKWAALQQRGVSYEQARDGAELGRYRPAKDRGEREGPAGEHQAIPRGDAAGGREVLGAISQTRGDGGGPGPELRGDNGQVAGNVHQDGRIPEGRPEWGFSLRGGGSDGQGKNPVVLVESGPHGDRQRNGWGSVVRDWLDRCRSFVARLRDEAKSRFVGLYDQTIPGPARAASNKAWDESLARAEEHARAIASGRIDPMAPYGRDKSGPSRGGRER